MLCICCRLRAFVLQYDVRLATKWSGVGVLISSVQLFPVILPYLRTIVRRKGWNLRTQTQAARQYRCQGSTGGVESGRRAEAATWTQEAAGKGKKTEGRHVAQSLRLALFDWNGLSSHTTGPCPTGLIYLATQRNVCAHVPQSRSHSCPCQTALI